MEQASSAFSTSVPALAAIPQLAGNSRQGFGPVDGTIRGASSWVISSNTLGIKGSLYDGDAGSRSTGKERDTESGNDYFGARYYASSMGRFMSPDWSAKASPVPYATFGDPQSLNLYAYMRNNPLGGADADGHCDIGCQFSIVMGIVNGIRRDGSVGAYAKNVGTGILKGAGSTAVNAIKMANAGTNPGAIAAAVLSPGPAALQPSNTTQAQASMVTQAVLPAAAGMAAGPLLGAAGEAESVGAGTTSLFRAVDATELESIQGTGQFLPSPSGTEYKGFFNTAEGAQSFSNLQSSSGGSPTTVVGATAPTDLVNSSPVHQAAQEAPGVLIKNENLPQVKPQ
jgi:RHS repeat-associated protein